MTYTKVCGLTRPEHALAAAQAGAAFVSVNFAPMSLRRVSVEQAQEVLGAVPPGPKKVGVFVNEDLATINRIAEACGLDYVQISGDEPWEALRAIERPIIRVLRLSSREGLEPIAREVGEQQRVYPGLIILLDTHVPGFYGGTGRVTDLGLAREAARRFPFLLAGGLTPENVNEVLRQVRPWGVDASSGLETKRVKDVEEIRAFVEAVRRFDGAYNTAPNATR